MHHDYDIPQPTLRRLPWYLAYVTMLRSRGVDYVSSTRIAEDLNLDASQIAKDLSYLAIKGKTRIGYEVAQLQQVLTGFLGFSHTHKAVVIGAGRLGRALMQDSGLENYGLKIVAGFDVNPQVIGREVNGVTVYHIDSLAEQTRLHDTQVAILTVPYEHAQAMASACVAAGIRGLWNFTPCPIRVPEGVMVQNTSIYSDLAVLYNSLVK